LTPSERKKFDTERGDTAETRDQKLNERWENAGAGILHKSKMLGSLPRSSACSPSLP